MEARGLALFESEFVSVPTERFPSCHCSSVVEAPSGDLLCCWYAGEGEAAADVAILTARKPVGAKEWEEPVAVADTPGKPEGNCVLYVMPDERLWLFYGTMHGRLQGHWGPGVRWDTVDQKYRVSEDEGRTWSRERFIRKEWGDVFRTKPILLANGEVIFGFECRDEMSRFLISPDCGKTWEYGFPIAGVENEQPTLIQRRDGVIVALLRPAGDEPRVGRSYSKNNGRTWSRAVNAEIPSPGAAIDMVKLADGRVVLVFNDSEEHRTPLTLGISKDDCETWYAKRNIETEEGEYSYPGIIQDRAGFVHVTYTYRRTHIKHVRAHPAWIEGKE
jgi:predicted neuraminidase